MNPITTSLSLDPLKNFSISREQIDQMRQRLDAKPRNLLLFDLATQTGMRLKDLLRLKVVDIQGLSVGKEIPVTRELSYLEKPVILTETLDRTIKKYMATDGKRPDDYLFQSRKRARPLNLPSASNMISGWFQAAGIDGFSGARGLNRIWRRYYKGTDEQRKTEADGDPIRTLEPIKTTTLQEVVYQRLLKAIIAGRIPPGEQLVLGKIAAQFKVSPMPVREAFNRLAEAGVITLQKKKSAVINTLSKEDLIEIQQIRINLETMAVEQACRSIDTQTLDDLQVLHQAYLEAFHDFRVEEILRLNRKFHFTIYSATHMPRLLNIINGLWDQISPYYHILLRKKEHLYTEKHADTHGQLLEKLRQKDVEGSVQALRADLQNAAELIITEFKKYRGFKPPDRQT
jgi:DNA-binding GntR family transcriptional regulator